MEKILVVVDMQKDFVDGSLGTKEAKSIVPNVVEKIKNWNGPIFVTYDTHRNNYLETSEGKKLPIMHCIKGTKGWQLDKNVEAALNEKSVPCTKITKPTFGSVDLPNIIRELYEDDISIELIGLCTDICVISNALILKANFYEREISVDSSCCAGVTHESHEEALQTMKMCQINVI